MSSWSVKRIIMNPHVTRIFIIVGTWFDMTGRPGPCTFQWHPSDIFYSFQAATGNHALHVFHKGVIIFILLVPYHSHIWISPIVGGNSVWLTYDLLSVSQPSLWPQIPFSYTSNQYHPTVNRLLYISSYCAASIPIVCYAKKQCRDPGIPIRLA